MKQDRVLLAGIIGASSTIPAELVTRAALFFGLGKYSAYQLDSLFFTLNRPSAVIGLIVCLVVGGLSAAVLFLALEWLGPRHLAIKCGMFGLVLCLAMQILLVLAIEGKYIDIRPISDYYIHMLGAVVFGVTEGLLFKKFLFKKIVRQS